jgi:hypothetical protein
MIQSRSLEAYLRNSNYIKKIYKYQYSILQNINVDINTIFKSLSSIDEINNNDATFKNTVMTNIQNIINCIDYKISQSFYNGLLVFSPLTVSPTSKLTPTATPYAYNLLSLSNSFYQNSLMPSTYSSSQVYAATNGTQFPITLGNYPPHQLQTFTVGTNMLGFDIFNMPAPTVTLDIDITITITATTGIFEIKKDSPLSVLDPTNANINGPENIISFFSPGNIFLLKDSTTNQAFIQINNYVTNTGNVIDAVKSFTFTVLATFDSAGAAVGTFAIFTGGSLTLMNYLSINSTYGTERKNINQWNAYDSTFLTSYINKLNIASTQIANMMAQIKVNMHNIESYNEILEDRICGARSLDSFFYLNQKTLLDRGEDNDVKDKEHCVCDFNDDK